MSVPAAGSIVLNENGRRSTRPGVVAGPDVDELAGARAGRELRGVVRLEPLVREDLAAVEQLGAGPAASSRGGRRRSAGVVGVAGVAARRLSSVASSASSSSPSSLLGVVALGVLGVLAVLKAAISGRSTGYASASASARSPNTSVGS